MPEPEGPSVERGMWTWTPIPKQEVISNWQLLTEKKLVTPMKFYWMFYRPLLKSAPCPAVDDQHKMNSRVFLKIFLSSIALLGLLFIYYCFWFHGFVCGCVSCAFSFCCCLFYCFFFVPLFSEEREKVWRWKCGGGEGDLGGDKGGVSHDLYCMKKILFN